MRHLTNEEIVGSLQEEFNEDLFEELVRRFKPLFAKYFHQHRLADYELEDYYQEGRLALLDALSKYSSKRLQKFSGFFQIVYKNRAYNLYRDALSERRGGKYYDLPLLVHRQDSPQDEFTILETYQDAYQLSVNKIVEMRDLKVTFINNLSYMERSVFIYYYSGKSQDEVAALLDIEKSQVRSALDRCRIKLRKMLMES